MDKKILVISDVDGCLTNGQFIYTCDGKIGKIFGVGDHEGVKLLRKNNIDVQFITADATGFPISNARITEMKCNLTLVPEKNRVSHIESYFTQYDKIIFFGDGLGDMPVKLKNPNIYFIAPKNGRKEVKKVADYVTPNEGAHGAFLDLSIHVVKHFIGKNYKALYN